MFMSCIHLNTFVSRESDSKITNVCQSVIKTPKKKDKDFSEKYTPMSDRHNSEMLRGFDD